ncbi:MAG: CDP-glycerol glycerophosphotransferase family protein [Odoribacter sp.]|nr:CDP-glycerol glycerophosphotransferase family protein [Odoribacter sp.]
MKFIAYLIGYLLYCFSLLVPRSKRIWVFGSFRGAFADNAKYLFIYVSKYHEKVFPVWISYKAETIRNVRKIGLRAYSLFSLKGLYYALRGGYYFFNAYTSDICFFTSGRAVRVNLWHGVGLKKIEFCIDKGPMYNRYVRKSWKERFFYPQVYRRPDYFLSSTAFQTVKFARAFRIKENQCMDSGYPRNDILLADEQDRQKFISVFEPDRTKALIGKFAGYKRIFLYMPTWRESQRNLFTDYMDLNRLNELMAEMDGLLVLKPHANTIVGSNVNIERCTNVLLLDASTDIYPILPYTHVLITDYSSVLYDYLLMENKDVILYLYDYQDYIKCRDFNYPFFENVAGEVAYSFPDLLKIIRSDEYDRSNYLSIRRKFWGDYNGKAAREIAAGFLGRLNF